jgi:hypothetical protein
MKQLSLFPDNAIFYRGTIIVLKGLNNTPKGIFDSRYCLISNIGANFEMLDVHRSMGSCILHSLKPNVQNHFAVDKNGIKKWVDEYFELFYTKEGYTEWISKIDDILFIEKLEDYFTQTNRNLFIK